MSVSLDSVAARSQSVTQDWVEENTKQPRGWRGRLCLELDRRNERTVLARKRQSGPLTVQRPFYPEGGGCHLYLLHPPGGLVGGDRLDVELSVAAGGRALLTTPGAAKFYRSNGSPAAVRQRIRVAGAGLVEWMPQESILFRGARARTETIVDLLDDAQFIGWEVHCLGRPAIGERFEQGSADLLFSIRRNGRPVLIDRLRIRDDGDLDGPSRLRGLPVCATFVATGASQAHLDAARRDVSAPQDVLLGQTLIDDLLLARCLSSSTESVTRTFRRLWGILRPRLAGIDACNPRIWAT